MFVKRGHKQGWKAPAGHFRWFELYDRFRTTGQNKAPQEPTPNDFSKIGAKGGLCFSMKNLFPAPDKFQGKASFMLHVTTNAQMRIVWASGKHQAPSPRSLPKQIDQP